jgi:hypothetical protein
MEVVVDTRTVLNHPDKLLEALLEHENSHGFVDDVIANSLCPAHHACATPQEDKHHVAEDLA